jgi:enoyl-CoA hydratase/carnithine racemase
VRLGLVDEVVPDAAKAAAEMIAVLAANAPLSVAGAKHIVNAIADGTAAGREAEIQRLIDGAMDSDDYQEGRRAFAEKRAPRFEGR